MTCKPIHENLIYLEGQEHSMKRPLLCFVNSKSGGQLGPALVESLGSLLSPDQVFELHECGGPQKGLEIFRDVKSISFLLFVDF